MEEDQITFSVGTDEGVSQAAATDSDITDVVESAGHFRVYLGAAAGVGKTFAMLSEGKRRHKRGADMVIALLNAMVGRAPKNCSTGLRLSVSNGRISRIDLQRNGP